VRKASSWNWPACCPQTDSSSAAGDPVDGQWLVRALAPVGGSCVRPGSIVPPQKTVAAIYSIVTNWKCAAVLVQSSLAGYSAFPHIKRDLPHAKLMDLVHSVDENWDLISVTAGLARQIDVRVAVSGAVRSRLLACGHPKTTL